MTFFVKALFRHLDAIMVTRVKKEGETRAFGETFCAWLSDCEVLLDGTHCGAKPTIFRVGQSSGKVGDHFFRVRGTKASPKGSPGALGEVSFDFKWFMRILGGIIFRQNRDTGEDIF